MKRLLVFLVLVGLAVPGWGADSTDIDMALVSEVVKEYWDRYRIRIRCATDSMSGDTTLIEVDSLLDSTYSFNFYAPASLVVLGAPASALFDSVWVFPPKRVSGGGMVLRLKGFYVTPRYPSVAEWPEIYHIYADTIIIKNKED